MNPFGGIVLIAAADSALCLFVFVHLFRCFFLSFNYFDNHEGRKDFEGVVLVAAAVPALSSTSAPGQSCHGAQTGRSNKTENVKTLA